MAARRNTIQRGLVLSAVRSMHNHPTADEIYRALSRSHPSLSRATVYRNLAVLAQEGEIRRVAHLNAADRFDFELAPHYHFRCTCCGGVFDVGLAYNHTLLQDVENPDGFVFEGYEITFTGQCPECKKQTINLEGTDKWQI